MLESDKAKEKNKVGKGDLKKKRVFVCVEWADEASLRRWHLC